MPGYLALHLLGLSAGTVLLPSSPSYFRRMQESLRNPNVPLSRGDDHRSDSESDDDLPNKKPKGRIQHRRENDKTATELFSYAVLWWMAFGVVTLAGIGYGISRRMVSTSFRACINALPNLSGCRSTCRTSSGWPRSTLHFCSGICCWT